MRNDRRRRGLAQHAERHAARRWLAGLLSRRREARKPLSILALMGIAMPMSEQRAAEVLVEKYHCSIAPDGPRQYVLTTRYGPREVAADFSEAYRALHLAEANIPIVFGARR